MYIKYIKPFFEGDERSVKAKKNVLFSFLLKGISILIGLMFVPLILDYLDAERYGIWLTLSSIIGWASFFDLGLGNGLRNRFTEAIAKNDHDLARVYVSTTYGILGILFLTVMILFVFINPFLNWQEIVNTTTISNQELGVISLIVFVFFILRFFFNIIGVILLADQRPAINNSFNPISNILSILIIYVLTKTTGGSLIALSSVLSIVPVLVLALATVFFFLKDYRRYIPSIRFFDLKKSKNLLGLGFKFFYIQIAAIIFFSSTNILIAQVSNQETVAAYNIAYKYLFVINMVQSIVLTPVWSAVTDAFGKSDYDWLKRSLRKLNILSFFMSIGIIGLLLISPIVYRVWIKDSIIIPFSLSFVIAIYLIQQVIVSPFTQFTNGLGKLRLSLVVLTFKIIAFFPLAYFLSLKYEAIGIVLAMLLIQIPSLIIEPIQVYKLVNNKAHGIWNK